MTIIQIRVVSRRDIYSSNTRSYIYCHKNVSLFTAKCRSSRFISLPFIRPPPPLPPVISVKVNKYRKIINKFQLNNFILIEIITNWFYRDRTLTVFVVAKNFVFRFNHDSRWSEQSQRVRYDITAKRATIQRRFASQVAWAPSAPVLALETRRFSACPRRSARNLRRFFWTLVWCGQRSSGSHPTRACRPRTRTSFPFSQTASAKCASRPRYCSWKLSSVWVSVVL